MHVCLKEGFRNHHGYSSHFILVDVPNGPSHCFVICFMFIYHITTKPHAWLNAFAVIVSGLVLAVCELYFWAYIQLYQRKTVVRTACSVLTCDTRVQGRAEGICDVGTGCQARNVSTQNPSVVIRL